MKVVVLGAAGYVGCVLCKKLVDRGIEVIAIDKGFFGFDGLKDIEPKIKLIKKDGFDLTKDDLTDVKCFFNLSGLSNDPMADFNPDLNFKLNTELTSHTANLCKECGIKYVFASTSSIYDFGVTEEKMDILVDETEKVEPTKFYSLSKYRAEKILLSMISEDFKVIILRKATICGYSPRMRYDLVLNTFIKDAFKHKRIKLNGGGENWRPLIDVNDVCEIYCKCIDFEKSGIYNAIGYNVRISELALRTASILERMDQKISIECDYSFPKSSMRNYRVDGTKLNQELNFVPQIDVQSSVKDMVSNINKICDFDNPIYYNIEWVRKYLQHWLKY